MVRLQDRKLVGKQHLDAANRSTTPLSETAGVSSSSSGGGGIIVQPKAVKPDLSDSDRKKKNGMPNYSGFESASKQSDFCCQCE